MKSTKFKGSSALKPTVQSPYIYSPQRSLLNHNRTKLTLPLLCLSLFLLSVTMNSNSNPNPFPWGIGWRDFFLMCSLGDRIKFKNTMEVCSNFSNIEDMHKKADTVVKKATMEELNDS